MKLSFTAKTGEKPNNFQINEKPQQLFNTNLTLKTASIPDSFNGKTLNAISQKPTFGEAVEIFFGRRSQKAKKKAIIKAKQKAITKTKNIKKPKPSNANYVRPEYAYKNMFETRLKAERHPELKTFLMNDKSVHDADRAYTRITSLSAYLKEQMVGFITPDNQHWFEKAMPYILKGSVAKDISGKEYNNAAKDFWGLLAKADNYWKSDAFIGYLKSMKPDDAIRATISAVESLQEKKTITFTGDGGYPSKIKYIPELLKRCAYTGSPMSPDGPAIYRPSAEHLLPHSIGGDKLNIDINYLVAGSKANSDRGSLPLMLYLKGWDQEEYSDYKQDLESKKAAKTKLAKAKS